MSSKQPGELSLSYRDHGYLIPGLDEVTAGEVFADAQRLKISKSTRIFNPGDPCKRFLIVITGSVKVLQISESGREIVLYRVQDHESCLLTTACLLADENYTVSALAETEVDALALPASTFSRCMENSAEMRRFVFKNYSTRMAEFFTLVQELAFETLDVRLSHRLLQQADRNRSVSMTHRELAAELGSTREVISRRLKEFEQLGWIRLHRGRIELIEPEALEENK